MPLLLVARMTTHTYEPPPRTKILLAVLPEKIERLARVLAYHELVLVSSSYEAMRHMISDDIGLVIQEAVDIVRPAAKMKIGMAGSSMAAGRSRIGTTTSARASSG